MTTQERMRQLAEQLASWNQAYYQDDAPLVSDAEYDRVFHELKQLETDHPDWVTYASPTQQVGFTAKATFAPMAHNPPMKSMHNIFSPDDIQGWVDACQKKAGNVTLVFTAEPKFDGVSLDLVYQKGKLHAAGTRGDGTVGEDVTANASQIGGVPHVLPGMESLVVRGEVVMPKAVFAKLNEGLIEKGDKPFASPRNAAAGSLRQSDPTITRERGLWFIPYRVEINTNGLNELPHLDVADLRSLGFTHADGFYLSQRHGAEGLMKDYLALLKERAGLPYEIDGVALKVGKRSLEGVIGQDARAPLWTLALKFPPNEQTTVLHSVDWQVGRTGVITPAANFEPVDIDGVTVSRATLHNAAEIERLGIALGDEIVVYRAGDVIPKIAMVSQQGKLRKLIKVPEWCPCCGTTLTQTETGLLFCSNRYGCRDQLERYLQHLVSRGAFDIDGIGDKLISQLLEKGIVEKPYQLFQLTKQELLGLDRMGEKSAEKLLQEIHAKSRIHLDKFIFALGIKDVGEETAKVLAKEIQTVEQLSALARERLVTLPGISTVLAESIAGQLEDPSEVGVLANAENLVRYGKVVVVPYQAPATVEGSLSGQTWVITGTFGERSRDSLKARLRNEGASVSDSITKQTTHLLVGDKPSSKVTKAEKLGITKMSMEDLFALLG